MKWYFVSTPKYFFIFVIFRYHMIDVLFWLNPVKKCEDKDKNCFVLYSQFDDI